MISKHNKNLVLNARELMKNMTKEEKHLWYDFLRTYPVRFLKQKVLGRYIADFYCAKAKLVIELDGSGHFCRRASPMMPREPNFSPVTIYWLSEL